MMPFANRLGKSLRLGSLAGTCVVAALAAGLATASQNAPAQAETPSLENSVARALAQASQAYAHGDELALSRALGILERAHARPLEGWDGPDPVAQWRAETTANGAPALTPPVYRGSPLGPGYRAGRIKGGASDRFEQVFLSGKKASIALSSAGSATLSLNVIDRDHHPVCRGRAEECQWVPLFTQRYSIEIHNPGQQPAEYFIVVD